MRSIIAHIIQMGWDGGLFLTLVAFQYIVAEEVPKVCLIPFSTWYMHVEHHRSHLSCACM